MNYDHVTGPQGEKSGGFGGVTYNLLALSHLMGRGARISVLTRVGAKHIRRYRRLLKEYPGLNSRGVLFSPQGTNECFLTYTSLTDRRERLLVRTDPFTRAELKPYLRSGLVLFNNIVGEEIGLDLVKYSRRNTRAMLMMDMHSKLLGIRSNGRRYRRALKNARGWLRQLDVVQANEWELGLVLGRRIRGEAGYRRALLEMLGAGPRAVVVTLGAKGSITAYRQPVGAPRSLRHSSAGATAGAAPPTGRAGQAPPLHAAPVIFRCPPYPVRQVRDTTGCGDVFSAGFIYGLVRFGDYKRASILASAAAGIRCEGKGLAGLKRLSGLEGKLRGELKRLWSALDGLGKGYSV